ncbi:uncharacterized protein EAF01_006707 [Botrytis porri]|uniref:Uncharacterized protein n=1 Tax=Botrytis porri TaxID=87229 RepID=A0A4Z1L4V7_9HELO|nr:uncharacterized protein EAF01_006707 [Botrytis porri]KAF7903658.1 hypothetical protein EAF01_006707 [Botrytis porri]TGO91808.1 hypothetical protein BPOR_0018g00240 [Botrytis porri]
MQLARKAVYTPHENESGRFWLKFGGRTINFIMTNEKQDKNDADDPGSEPLRGPFERGMWVGFGTRNFKDEKVGNKEDTNKISEMDDKGLDMK